MAQRIFADSILVLHFMFIIFVVVGGLLALRWRWIPLLHLPAALWAIFIELSGGVCPLTALENALRRAAGSSGYSGGFVEHYLLPVVYPPSLSHSLERVLAGVVFLTNVVIYLAVLRRRGTRRRLAG